MSEPEGSAREEPMQPCSCLGDPFAALPVEPVPRPAPKPSLLRHTTCPACGRSYRTNRKTDLCMDCEAQGVRLPDSCAGVDE
jgi:hypothetical protein